MRIKCIVLAVCIFAVCFTGCTQNNTSVPTPIHTIPQYTAQSTSAPTLPKTTQTPQYTKASATTEYYLSLPLLIDTERSEQDGVILVLPRVTGGAGEEIIAKINQGIQNAENELMLLTGHTGGEKMTCGYEIKSNQRGIFSLLLTARSISEPESVFVKPVTFYCSTGEMLLLNELFSEDANWQGRLLDEVNKVADDMNMDLINEVPPVTETNEFYIADKLLVLVYQQYEIASYASGIPQIPIPMYMISDIMDQQYYQWLAK